MEQQKEETPELKLPDAYEIADSFDYEQVVFDEELEVGTWMLDKDNVQNAVQEGIDATNEYWEKRILEEVEKAFDACLEGADKEEYMSYIKKTIKH